MPQGRHVCPKEGRVVYLGMGHSIRDGALQVEALKIVHPIVKLITNHIVFNSFHLFNAY
jgi:hypothetical protein